jgi:hypothetical protein
VATLTPAQIYTLAHQAGLSAMAATTATAIALAESGGKTDAVGDVGLQDAKWGPSIGLWQIRSLKAETGTGSPRDASRLKDPYFNAKAMVSISGGGGSWRPWSTYTSGSYKKFLSPAATGAADPAANAAAPGFGAQIVGDAVDGALTAWAKPAFGIGLKIIGAGAAAALVIVGAVHTVKS